ncbi:Nn.00g064870.m01.CDS01 [Neocucurbitaria sp. VM-36]
MDTDMTDVAYDIDIDVGAGAEAAAQQPQQIIEQDITATDDKGVPAAYYEDIEIQKPWPEALNLQGVGDFDPNDPLYYAMEHCGADPRVKQLRWVNDSSVNLEFYSAQDAAVALGILTHAEVGDPNSLAAQAPRKAKPYSKKPDSVLMIRETNAGDQKPKGAATRSRYYKENPDVAGNRQREPRRRPPPKKDFLDYGDDDMGSRERVRRRSSGDMNDDSGVDRRRPRRNGQDSRDTRGRGGRLSREADSGRLRSDVDRYRPGSRSPHEPRHGRLRGRSASPGSNDEGDGRFGFAEDTSNARRRYRSRSRSRNTRRQRAPSGERWTHDRANYGDRNSGASGGRWQKDALMFDSSPMGNHRRSDAMDASRSGGSLLARMTKDGQPVVPQQKRSLADRITRDDDDGDDMFGRLKNDDRDPWVSDFSEPTRPRGLAERISRDTEINIRGRSQEGINIRGSASNNGAAGGINIRGVASGA